ncbi:hypothetical protein CMU30_13870 [Elizabethkingia anophelis]|nr:hypothetical protein [Elizabethkingia anophelis]MDV3684366.1 hypothetical protein [Elizabethkingia anophelis]MDV3699708.1 hypothetical protein [Elizabethkingia anophelis]MDV3763639.1 hypothetical protein [Elizabethkingia anophelis]MDV3802627.1 hypothetical protein [Elizabethkingia anophelis]
MEGKAKDAFKKFCYENDYTLFTENEKYKDLEMFNNALIIEWLDSVKLNAYIVPVKSGWFSCIRNGDNDLTHGFFIDRESATEAAIKKAVEIYNEKYKEQ